MQIIQIQNFSNYIIEQNETAEFELQNYFSGALLDYSVDIVSPFDPLPFIYKQFYAVLINLTPPLKNIHHQNINPEIPVSSLDPFPSSTLMLQENNGTQITLFMVDTNFIFYKFDASQYNKGIVTQIYQVQMNTSIVNDSCHDLTQINYGLEQSSLIIFCRSEIYKDDGEFDHAIQTIVQFDMNLIPFPPPNFKNIESFDWNFRPTVRYNSFYQTTIVLDAIGGIKFLGYEKTIDNSIEVLFLAQQYPTYVNVYNPKVIAKMNFSEFIDMAYQNITYQYNMQGSLTTKLSIQIEDSLTNQPISNYGVVSYEPVIIGYIIDNVGVLLCQLTDYDLYTPITSWVQINHYIYCNTANSSQLIHMENALSLYFNQFDPSYFFIAQSNPPGVIEVNIDDPYNAYIFKQYQLHVESPAFVGLKTLSANKNIIVHLMLNLETGNQVLRLYNRNSSHFNMAKYNYPLPPKSRTNFFIFPSFYQNTLLFRDEIRINVTTFFDYRLNLNSTNEQWFQTFKYEIFEVTLTVRNEFTSIQSQFNVTFVDDNFTQPITAGDVSQELSIFYNCGDDSFQYEVSDLFDGPNFEISYDTKDPEDCSQGYCYFEIKNQKIEKLFDSNFTQAQCNQNFIFPDIDSMSDQSESIILVCIDNEQQTISSYKLNQENKTVELINDIQIPQLKFVFAGANIQERGLFVIAEINEQEWFTQDNEVHFFSIQGNILWKNFTQSAIQLQGYNLSDLNIFVYNQYINKGIMVSYKQNQTQQIMLYFEVNGTQSKFNVISQYTFPNETVRVALSQEGFVYALQADQYLNIYQIIEINQQFSFVLLKSRLLDNCDYKPNQMDIHNDFFIVYYGLNDILVYEIQNYIDLVYKMKLPLYQEYSGFRFSLFGALNPKYAFDTQLIINDYYGDYLSLIMVNPNFNGKYSMFIFVYSLLDFQHNSLVMTKDVTELFKQAKSRQIVLTGNQISTNLVLISNYRIALYDVQFYNSLQLTDDEKFRAQLIQNCSNSKFTASFGHYQEAPTLIGNILIKATSMMSQTQYSNQNNQVLLKIYTQNQGIAITPASNLPAIRELYFGYGDSVQKEMIMSVENLVQGYNMSYEVNCTFYDIDGNIQSCLDQGVVDSTLSLTYNFYIEFVTQIRQVLRSFTLGNLFVMFDTLNMITVQTLQNSDLDLDNANGMALDLKGEYTQMDKLGCNIDGFINIYRCLWIDDDPNSTYTLYLAIYECKINQTLYLRMAKIQIFDQNQDLQITVLQNQQKIPYRIIDIDRGNVTVVKNDQSKIKVTVAMSVENPGSTSNLLFVQNLTIDILNNVTIYEPLELSNSNSLDKDTFKIKQLLSIPNSDLLVIVDVLFGIYIYDLDQLIILKEFDLKSDNDFQDQSEKSLGDLRVFTVSGNWPYSIHVLTNYGIFIYNFGVDLTNRQEILPFYDQNLEPISKKIIRYIFDEFGDQIAFNDYGYSFLMTRTTSKTSFDVYLGVISYFSNSNSKLFRIMKVASDQICLSLNQESELVGDDEDELTVSFVCNTQLFIVRTCLKPKLILNMQSYLGQSTRKRNGRDIPGAYQYNQFNITIDAYNEYSKNGLNQAQVTVNLFQKTYPDQRFPEFYLICSFVLCTMITLIMLLAVGSKKVSSDDDKKGAFDDNLIPKMSMSFSEQRTSTLANQSSFVPGTGFKLLNLQNINQIQKFQGKNTPYYNPIVTQSEAESPTERQDLIDSQIGPGKVKFQSPRTQARKIIKDTDAPRFEMLSSEVIPESFTKEKPLYSNPIKRNSQMSLGYT